MLKLLLYTHARSGFNIASEQEEENVGEKVRALKPKLCDMRDISFHNFFWWWTG